jgi:translocation and assembly module TamA
MHSTQRSFFPMKCWIAYGFAVSFFALSNNALAQTALPNPTKSGLRLAIERAESGSWLTPPSIAQRSEAALTYLRSEGYYSARIEVLEANSDAPKDMSEGLLLAIPDDERRLFVRQGSQFTISSATVSIAGSKSPSFETARMSVDRLALGLVNTPARSIDVLRVQSQALVAVKDAGFTQAQDQYPDIVVDHATQTMSIAYGVAAGPLTTLSGVAVTGAALTPQAWVVKTAAVTSGDIATGDRLRKIAERFRLTGAYQSVEIALGPVQEVTAATGIAALNLDLQERTKRTWSAGAEWSTSDGLGIDASTSFFHRLHRADTLTLDGRIGTLESSIGASLRLPSFRGPSRDLFLEARAGQETTDAFDRLIARLSATYAIPRGRKDLLTYGLGLDVTRTSTPLQIRSGLLARDIDGADLSVLVRYERDRADDIINPTQGWRAQGELLPSVFFGDGKTIPYGRLVLAGSVYRPFSALRNGVLAARFKAGVLITSDDRLPFDRRFFAGGGGSVRGYAYQSIGPRDVDDNPIGGRSLIEGSLEARWSLRGPFGIAVFADGARVGALSAGQAQETKVGVGVGLRYNLGLAPLRIDIAVPLNKRDGDPPVQLYLSAGQSF